jgi:hypothetical protein
MPKEDAPSEEERKMATVMIHHDVKDVEHWLSSPKRAEIMGPMGIKTIRTFVDPNKSNKVGLILEVPDVSALPGMMQSPEAADAMAYDGVILETVVVLVES